MASVESLKVLAIGGRTDSAGTDQDDVDQEEMRLLLTSLLTPGYTVNQLTQAPNTSAFNVRQDTGSNMQLKIGSGTTKRDGYVILGTVAGQGAYLVRLDAATKTITVPATDATNPAKYSVFLYVNDAAYSGTASRAYANIECLRGTPAGSPSEPSPTATWSAYARLWTFQLAANATAVTNTILDAGTDYRAPAGRAWDGVRIGQATSSSGAFTTAETTVVSVTTPLVSTRKYRVSYTFPIQATVASVQMGLKVCDLSNNAIITRTMQTGAQTAVDDIVSGTEYITGQSVTGVRVRVVRQSGSGSITLPMSSSSPATIMVEDLGVA